MSVGFPTTKNDIDGQAGRLGLALRDGFRQVNDMKVYLDSLQDSDLTGLGYSAGEVTILRAAVTDLYNLGRVANAQQAQAAANDFFFNARKLLGFH